MKLIEKTSKNVIYIKFYQKSLQIIEYLQVIASSMREMVTASF